MEFKTRYITADEFKQYFGIDLQIELPNGDNESGKVAAYIARIENRLEAWINANYFYNVSQFWETLNDNQKEQYKYALLEQAYYVLRMGDISVDSGYDKERGVIAGRSTINELSVAPNSMLHLENGGFLNTRIVKRGGYYQGGVATAQQVDGGGVGQKGEPGKDGLTPFIGSNGNWWIGGLDTGVVAAGQQGIPGTNGTNGIDGSGFGQLVLDNSSEITLDTIPNGASKTFLVVGNGVATSEGLLGFIITGYMGGNEYTNIATAYLGDMIHIGVYYDEVFIWVNGNSIVYNPQIPRQEYSLSFYGQFLKAVEIL